MKKKIFFLVLICLLTLLMSVSACMVVETPPTAPPNPAFAGATESPNKKITTEVNSLEVIEIETLLIVWAEQYDVATKKYEALVGEKIRTTGRVLKIEREDDTRGSSLTIEIVLKPTSQKSYYSLLVETRSDKGLYNDAAKIKDGDIVTVEGTFLGTRTINNTSLIDGIGSIKWGMELEKFIW